MDRRKDIMLSLEARVHVEQIKFQMFIRLAITHNCYNIKFIYLKSKQKDSESKTKVLLWFIHTFLGLTIQSRKPNYNFFTHAIIHSVIIFSLLSTKYSKF